MRCCARARAARRARPAPRRGHARRAPARDLRRRRAADAARRRARPQPRGRRALRAQGPEPDRRRGRDRDELAGDRRAGAARAGTAGGAARPGPRRRALVPARGRHRPEVLRAPLHAARRPPSGADELDERALHDWGAAVARVGRGLRGFFHPAARYEIAWDIARASEQRADVGIVAAAGRGVVATALDRFAAHVEPVLGGLRGQVVHNDLGRANVLVDERGGVSGIIDFGDMTHTAWSAISRRGRGRAQRARRRAGGDARDDRRPPHGHPARG